MRPVRASSVARFLQRVVAAFVLSVFALAPVAFAQVASVAAISAHEAPREERIAQTHGVVQRAHAVTSASPERAAAFGPALVRAFAPSIASASFLALANVVTTTTAFVSLEASAPRARGPPIA
jgi:hypothetical protein